MEAPVAKVSVQEEEMDKVLNLMGAGKGSGFEIVTGIPMVDDDNFCRYRCMCIDSGCKKFEPQCQYGCFRCGKEKGFELVTGIPCQDDDNFCREECLCCEYGCVKMEMKFQYYCLKFEF